MASHFNVKMQAEGFMEILKTGFRLQLDTFFRGDLFLEASLEVAGEAHEQGDQDEGEEGGDEQAANDDAAEAAVEFRA